MPILIGTIVTQYDPDEGKLTCQNGACVGHVESIGELFCSPSVSGWWWQMCQHHDDRGSLRMTRLLDEVWEIGQIPAGMIEGKPW